MNESRSTGKPSALLLAAGADREGESRGLGISTIAFKVTTSDPNGAFILENTFLAKGGPARHLHYDQEEWFYILEGEFQFEVGADHFHLHPGDSLLAPRRVLHVWAFVGEGRGRILVAFFPAGKMEAFFREVTKANAMPPQDPGGWRAHGMELLGPPLLVEEERGHIPKKQTDPASAKRKGNQFPWPSANTSFCVLEQQRMS
jgi:quercetin dioxygenase-like cupin family protein